MPFVVSLASLIAGGMMAGNSGNVVPAVLPTLALAAVIGLVNGLIVARLNVHGFIATLGMGLIISGYLATNYKGSSARRPWRSASSAPPASARSRSPRSSCWCAALPVLMLHRTRLGHHLYAVGGDTEVARISGIRMEVPVITAHVLCSVLAAMAGLLLASRLGVGSPPSAPRATTT